MQIKMVASDEELRDVYRVRYKVYCLERGYERPDDYPHGMETDEYDAYSVHFIAYLKKMPMGTVRLILQNPLGFPVEKYCGINVQSFYSNIPKVAEISRLAVSSEAAKGCLIERSRITLGLLKQLHLAAKGLKIECFFSAMSLPLERLLNRCGMRFKKAGPPVYYNGVRTPYYALCEELEEEVFENRRDIFDFFFPSHACLSAQDPVFSS
jgi:N-acyl-L-homoserine lactone synthetase